MKTLSFGLGALGIIVPILVLLVDALSGTGYPAWSPFAWPSMILLLPYGGSAFDAEKIGVTVLSVGLNGALYSIVGLLVGAVLSKLREK